MQSQQPNPQNVAIVHIFSEKLDNSNLTNNFDIVNLIENNTVFLAQHSVEYIILDNLNSGRLNNNSDFLLKNISKIPSFQNKKLEYIKENFTNLKQSFLTGTRIANNENIFFVKNNTIININNVYEIEKTAPLLQKQDLNYFIQNVPSNFHPKDFRLHMKKNKSILDEIRLFFNY